MDGPRPVRPEEFRSLMQLIDTVFPGYSDGMAAAYPLLFDYKNCRNLRVFEDGGRIVSHVGIHLSEVITLGCRLKMASVGSVATYEEYRGKGLASACLEAAEMDAVRQGASITSISGSRGLYKRFGAVKTGKSLVYSIPAGSAAEGLTVRKAAAGDITTIERLYEREAVRYHRPLEDWQTTFEAMSHDAPFHRSAIYLFSDGGIVTGYAYITYGVWDGNPYARVSEYAGYRSHLAGALPSVASQIGHKAVDLRVPDYDLSLKRAAAQTKLEHKVDYLTHHTMKVSCLESFVRGLKPYIEERLGRSGAGGIAFQPGPGGTYDVIIGEEHSAFDPAAFTALAFGTPDREAAEAGDGLLERVFPVPLPLPGLNYV